MDVWGHTLIQTLLILHILNHTQEYHSIVHVLDRTPWDIYMHISVIMGGEWNWISNTVYAINTWMLITYFHWISQVTGFFHKNLKKISEGYVAVICFNHSCSFYINFVHFNQERSICISLRSLTCGRIFWRNIKDFIISEKLKWYMCM